MFGPHKQSSSVFRYSASKAVKMMVGEKDVKIPLTSKQKKSKTKDIENLILAKSQIRIQTFEDT